MAKFFVLSDKEQEALFRQDPSTKGDGGFQSFMIRLQQKYRKGTQEIRLEDADIDDIQRYAFGYRQGGWETRLMTIFERHLGPKLGRDGE